MYKDILFPVDLGQKGSTAQIGLEDAIAVARLFQAKLHVMSVVPDYGMSVVGHFFPKDYEEKAMKKAQEAIHEFTKAHIPSDIGIHHIIAHGTVYEQILSIQKQISADLIIIGSHRPELKDYLLGPNAARVVRHAPCSVLVVRN